MNNFITYFYKRRKIMNYKYNIFAYMGVSTAKKDQIENFIKNFFISEIDVNFII